MAKEYPKGMAQTGRWEVAVCFGT